jgi:hypothetical protein
MDYLPGAKRYDGDSIQAVWTIGDRIGYRNQPS